jgi:acetoacetate decarboxylase
MSDPTAQGSPQGNPGDILNWPMLKLVYRTDPDKVAALLPPGFSSASDPLVTLTVYNFPVQNEPELGLVMNVAANYDGIEGEYCLGYAIDQEQAVYISREHWGQPKYLADIRYFRLMDQVEARVTHKGYSFVEFKGAVSTTDEPGEIIEANEWWIKCARAVTMQPNEYDYPPHVVRVYAKYRTAFRQSLEGELVLRESPWDPLAQALPMLEQVDAYLWWPEFLDRQITLAGPLDEEGFWPFADTIGGTRFPGAHGGPA